MTPGRARALAGASCLGVIGCCVAVAGSRGLFVEGLPLLGVILLWSGLAALLAWAARRALTVRATVVGGLLLSAGLQVVGMAGGPQLSDDLYRYVWDARVAAAGTDPYAYPPGADELRGLRTPDLWPAAEECATLPPERARWDRSSPFLGLTRETDCTPINRRDVRTIYPPAAQLVFRAQYALTPGLPVEVRVELPMALVCLALVAAMMRLLVRRGRHPAPVLAYAVGPLAVVECGMDGHLDVVGVALAVLCLHLAGSTRVGRAASAALVGATFALAVLIKLYPALLAVPLVARLGWRSAATWGAAAAALGVGALLYAPHVAASGLDVIGYLPGYLRENDYGGGSNYQVLNLLLPSVLVTAVAGAALLAIGVWALTRQVHDGQELLRHATTFLGLVLLVVTPGTPWYYALLVVLALLADRPEWQVLAPAAYVAYFVNLERESPLLAQLAFTAAAGLVLVVGRRRNATPEHDVTSATRL